MKPKFTGKVLVIGYGAVSRCALPLIFKLIDVPPKNVTVMDFAPVTLEGIKEHGVKFVKEKIERATMGKQLGKYVWRGDMIIDLAWNIGCHDILQWCHDHDVLYVNTSVELWDPYEGADTKPPTERTLYVRQMALRQMIAAWKNPKGATAVVDHGANPGLVSHFTKQALEDIANKWLAEHKAKARPAARRSTTPSPAQYNRLASDLGVKVIHISERDTQISDKPKGVNEFVNTWSIEGFFEEGTAPAEMGWGTHEKMPAAAGARATARARATRSAWPISAAGRGCAPGCPPARSSAWSSATARHSRSATT